MKNFKSIVLSIAVVFGLTAQMALTSCSDDKTEEAPATAMLTFTKGDQQSRELSIDDKLEVSVQFTARMRWTAAKQNNASWLTLSSESGGGGTHTLTFYATRNTGKDARKEVVTITCGEQKENLTIVQAGSDVSIINPSSIPNYDKFFHNSEHGGDKILKSDSKFSFARYKQSEHFFVFWDKYFGDDPNGPDVASGDRVDVDDLLQKAEHFFHTNIETLGMAVLGQGKSVLDQYKMQIYILDPTPEWWVATGSGYDDMIGALWVTPATCQPVGSTIAHEIGHSFQYQVYADKVQCDGAPNNYHHGFRYGFGNNGDGGCGYWEQCAQWQSYQDYPDEQFESYNFSEWVANHHRHFHHEWMRYASYWLQTYWVEKHGISAYGRIWRESAFPEDAIETYTRIFNGGDWGKTREELFDYAVHMATFDMASLPSIKQNYLDVYSTSMLRNSEGYYQPTLANCPGATGFNVIPLNVPEGGGKVVVDFRGLESGAPLLADDPGEYRDGDGRPAGTTRTYNAGPQAGWRYGFVAYANGSRTYSSVGSAKEGTLEFDVPDDASRLYLVVQGSPESYYRHAWNDDEKDDLMYPYAVKFQGTGLLGVFDIDLSAEPHDVDISYEVSCDANAQDYAQGTLSLANFDICQGLVIAPDVLESAILNVGVAPTEGKVAVQSRETNGKLVSDGRANNGFWLDADGNNSYWGENGYIYFEINGTTLTYGSYPGHCEAGKTYEMRPVLVYVKDGKEYYANITITLKF